MRRLLITGLLLLLPVLVEAQTTRTLIWNYPGKTLANVATWTQVIKVNGTVLVGPPVCGQNGVNVECSIPLGILNQTTNNVLSVSASASNETYESILNYNPSTTNPNGPTNPSGLGIRVTVTVIIGTP